jgi:hypothetical protein
MALVLLVVVVSVIFGLIRNTLVLYSRNQFLAQKPSLFRLYQALPSYEEMVFHPRFYLMWTPGQWRVWAERLERSSRTDEPK